MKKLMVAVAMLAVAGSVMAGPLAQTAKPVEVGQINGAALLSFGLGDAMDDMQADIRARVTYGAIENLLVSLELGITMNDIMDDNIPLAVALQYTLPIDQVVDVALRCSLDIGDLAPPEGVDMSDTMVVTPGVVVSYQTPVEWLAIYAGLGYYIPFADGADGGIALAFGGAFDCASLVENLSAVAELSMFDPGVDGIDMTDTMALTLGASYAF
jgi:hypothetical protein